VWEKLIGVDVHEQKEYENKENSNDSLGPKESSTSYGKVLNGYVRWLDERLILGEGKGRSRLLHSKKRPQQEIKNERGETGQAEHKKKRSKWDRTGEGWGIPKKKKKRTQKNRRCDQQKKKSLSWQEEVRKI